jgi:antitoxin VapB
MAVTGERRAKLFKNGRSQAVRLPKEFRFEGNEVTVRRDGESVVLGPVVRSRKADDWAWLDEIRARLDPSFFEGLGEQQEPQERPELDRLFP